jgi:hypothetical protein
MSQFGSSQFQGQRPLQQTPATKPASEEGTIGLIGETEAGAVESKIKAIGLSGTSHRKERWTRKTSATGSGACRVRSFHGRLSAQGLEYMDNQINEWLDQHPDVEVKQVTSNVGIFEGKMREPALILNIWY